MIGGDVVEVEEPFFGPEGDALVPRPHASSPWSDEMLHGRLLAGVAARAMERDHGEDDLQFARLTVDMFKVPPMRPLHVEARRVRDGRRVRALDAVVCVDDEAVARASALLLRRGEHPGGRVWRPPAWDAPHPDEVDPAQPATAGWSAPWEMRRLAPGGFDVVARKRTWLRENRLLVEGEALTPLQRAAMAADLASPLANAGDRGLEFINADLTLYLHRLPVGTWLGMEVIHHSGAAGVAVGACDVHDLEGPVGTASVCALANARRSPA